MFKIAETPVVLYGFTVENPLRGSAALIPETANPQS
jgi:hypothetical protein